jgi:hypothetical protein
MKPELLKLKKEKAETNDKIEKWQKLLEKNSVHPRQEVIKRMITHPEAFDKDESESFEKHVRICADCRDKLGIASFEELEERAS